MSEKFRDSWRKVIEGVSLGFAFAPIILLSFAGATMMVLIASAIKGVIVGVCWNMAMAEMFGFQKITVFQACMLALAISCLRSSYLGSANYRDLKERLSKECQEEKTVKAISLLFSILLELISSFIAVGVVMYSWNNILPQLLNIELVHIDFAQAFSLAYFCHLFLGVSRTDDEKLKKDKDNEVQKQIATEEDAATEAESEDSLC